MRVADGECICVRGPRCRGRGGIRHGRHVEGHDLAQQKCAAVFEGPEPVFEGSSLALVACTRPLRPTASRSLQETTVTNQKALPRGKWGHPVPKKINQTSIGNNKDHSRSMRVLVPKSGNLYQILQKYLRIDAKFSPHPISLF